MKRNALVLVLACLTAGCSSFTLGGIAYCPAKHDCTVQIRPVVQLNN